MTKVSRNVKLITTLILLVLAFCCSFNVTYSYFTASASKSGSLNFPDLDVRFVTTDKNNDIVQNGSYTQDSLYTIELYPMGGTISRGATFVLSLDEYTTGGTQEEIGNIVIKNMENSTDAYVRFWVDAYIVNDDGTLNITKNYGKYFLFEMTDDSYFVRGGTGSNTTEETNSCYFAEPLYAGTSYDYINLGNTLSFSDLTGDEIPADVLGEKLKITLTLEAVQTTNNAFTSVFNDEKGYYSNWQ